MINGCIFVKYSTETKGTLPIIGVFWCNAKCLICKFHTGIDID